MLPLPLQFLAAWIGTWVCRAQAAQIEYLAEQNRILMARLGKRALRLDDGERRRLAVLGKELGRKALAAVSTIATPDHAERNHQGLANRLIKGAPTPVKTNGPIQKRERVGGLLNFYHRQAA